MVCAYGEVVHVGEEDGGLDNLGDVGASGLKDGRDVLAALGSLVGNAALDEGAVGLEGDLAGEVDDVGGLDGLGLARGRGWSDRACHIESIGLWQLRNRFQDTYVRAQGYTAEKRRSAELLS